MLSEHQQPLRIQVVLCLLFYPYLLSHESLTVLQMMPLHDGGAVETSQGRTTPGGQMDRRGSGVKGSTSTSVCVQCSVNAMINEENLLSLVEIVGPSVVNIVAECSGHHGEGIQVGVVPPQFPCLKGDNKRDGFKVSFLH